MNRNLALFAGATVGGAVGYFVSAVVSDYIEEKEIRDLAPVGVLEDDEEQPTDEDEDEDTSSGKPPMKKKKQKVKREKTNYTNYFLSVDRPDLAALAKKYNEGTPEGESNQNGLVATMIAVDEFEDLPKGKPSLDDITIISQDDFNNNPDEFEIVELSYYADEIVVGEDDNIIPGPEDIIGNDALVSFGVLSGDPDIVYVRNPKTRALYEVVRMSVKYAIDAYADEIKPRRGLKKGIDFDEVTDDENDEEAAP